MGDFVPRECTTSCKGFIGNGTGSQSIYLIDLPSCCVKSALCANHDSLYMECQHFTYVQLSVIRSV